MTSVADRLVAAVNRERLLDTAVQLVAVPSRTGEAGAVLDCLAAILTKDGFQVERPEGGHAAAPAVAVRWQGKKPGRVVQFNGHLDTVHLPFIPPQVEGDLLTGSGSSDMKAGTAAAVEALRALRDAEALEAGGVLFTGHDLHETPWGDGSQLHRLIEEGYVGDAVLLPEYLNQCLPVIGRGGLIWKAKALRFGPPIHEVMRPDEPSVIAAGAELVRRLNLLAQTIATHADPMAGTASLFIGQIHSGEIFNQYPQQLLLEGTRRWLPGTRRGDVEQQLRDVFVETEKATGVAIHAEFMLMRDAFVLDQSHPFVPAFQSAYRATAGQNLPIGAKPFCDDGNSFWSQANIPAITHGPKAGGAHTLNEWVSIDDLVRVAKVYALTTVEFCGA